MHLLNRERWDDLVLESIFQMNRAKGNILINDLAGQFNLSRRHFQRRFTRVVGIGPKELAGIIRFQKALCSTRKGLRWPDIIMEYGYYDQAHLIRELKRYSGFSREKIFSTNPPTSLMRRFNANRKMSHLYNTAYL